jgi:DNA-binding MarR family transcriptional regulator
MGELASALGITTGSATTACKRLEKSGLLTRERQTSDERIVHVALTEQGCELIDTWRQRKRAALIQLLNVLEPRDQEELQRIIEHLLHVTETQGFGEER